MLNLKAFAFRVFLWLPVVFAAWYYVSILWLTPLAAAIDVLMVSLLPSILEHIVQDGTTLTVVTRLLVTPLGGGADSVGEIVFEMNPLKYGYSVALYTALVLASAHGDAVAARRWLLGVVVLFGVMVFGIATELLKLLIFDLHVYTEPTGIFPTWVHDPVALAYQFGYLILPPVAPIMLWLVQFHDYWGQYRPVADA